jgi:hypothetical protein
MAAVEAAAVRAASLLLRTEAAVQGVSLKTLACVPTQERS